MPVGAHSKPILRTVVEDNDIVELLVGVERLLQWARKIVV
jgi:hypothetical protein